MNDRRIDTNSVDDTVVRPRVPQRHGAGPGEPDLDDTVIRLIEPEPIRPAGRLPVEAVPPADPPTAPPMAWSLRVRGTTTVVPLDVPVVIGRRPGAPRPSENPVPRRLVIPGDRADVSARHARIERLGHSLVVADLGSTNGVVVHWSTGASLRLRAGESCAVLPDAIISLGDGVEIEFIAPPASVFPQSPHPSLPSEPS